MMMQLNQSCGPQQQAPSCSSVSLGDALMDLGAAAAAVLFPEQRPAQSNMLAVVSPAGQQVIVNGASPSSTSGASSHFLDAFFAPSSSSSSNVASSSFISTNDFLYLAQWLAIWIACGWLMYGYLFSVRKLSRRDPTTVEFMARSISLVHASFSVVFGVIILASIVLDPAQRETFFRWDSCYSNPNTPGARLNLLFSISYFLYDTLSMLVVGPYSPLFLAHHLGSLACLFAPLIGPAAGFGADETSLTLLVLEMSNPFLHGRWLLLRYREVFHPSSVAPTPPMTPPASPSTPSPPTLDTPPASSTVSTTTTAAEAVPPAQRTLAESGMPSALIDRVNQAWMWTFAISRFGAAPPMMIWLVLGPTTPAAVELIAAAFLFVSFRFLLNARRLTKAGLDFDV